MATPHTEQPRPTPHSADKLLATTLDDLAVIWHTAQAWDRERRAAVYYAALGASSDPDATLGGTATPDLRVAGRALVPDRYAAAALRAQLSLAKEVGQLLKRVRLVDLAYDADRTTPRTNTQSAGHDHEERGS
jgi:hypothetical protein